MNSRSNRDYTATDSLPDFLDIEQIALEVFGDKWYPELLRVPKDLAADHASYELCLTCEDGSCFEVTMETSTGCLKNKDREATVDFLKLLRDYLLKTSWFPIRAISRRSVDAFLLAMVFLVFSIGVFALFVARAGSPELDSIPEWMRVKNLAELKFLIWEAILAAGVVASVENFVAPAQALTWAAPILPIGVLILAAGLYLARLAH